jgi:nucleoside-diphosphate-sugar epimerase
MSNSEGTGRSGMKVFVAGATGTLGRPVVRRLLARGHEVIGLTRSPSKRGLIESLGARAVTGDALDKEAMLRIVRETAPTHVAHLLTALPAFAPLRASQLKATNELRERGTENLLAASVAAGVKRMVLESFLGVYGSGPPDLLLTEDSPLPPIPDRSQTRDVALALRSLESQAAQAAQAGRLECVVLRFGLFYGPEVPSTAELARRLRARQVFVPKGADGAASFIHIEDAAAATVAALEHPSPGGVYNIVDDEPVAMTEYLSLMAQAFEAPPPRTAPVWLIRAVAPLMAGMAFNRLTLSNAKARRELGWRPKHPSMRGVADLAA